MIENIGLIHNNILPDADSFSANSQNPEYPASNLLLDPPSILYKSLNGTVQITASYTEAVETQAFGIINHNLPSDTTCFVEASNNGFVSSSQYDLTYSPTNMIYILQNPISFKDYRYNFNCTDSQYIVTIGYLALASWLPLKYWIKNPVKPKIVRNMDVIRPKTGGVTRRLKTRYWEYTLNFRKVPEADFLNIVNALDSDRAKILVLDRQTQKVIQGNDTEDISIENVNTFNDFPLTFTENPLEIK